MNKRNVELGGWEEVEKELNNYIESEGFAKIARRSLKVAQNKLYNIEKSAMETTKGKYSMGITPPELVKSKVYRVKKGKNKGSYAAKLGFNWGDNNYEVYKFIRALEYGYRKDPDTGEIVEYDTPKEDLITENLNENREVLYNTIKEELSKIKL